jgi:hypothetical protein
VTRRHVDGLGWIDDPPPAPSWRLTGGPWIFVESDPGTCPEGPWTRLDIFPDNIAPGAPLWRCPGGYVPQMEGGDQGAACLEFCQQWHGNGSIAPVTTGGIDPAPFLTLNVTSVFCEAYLQGQPNAEDKVGELYREGWLDVVPVVGVDWTGQNGTFTLDDYLPWLRQFGSRFGVYASDPMGAASWARLRALLA